MQSAANSLYSINQAYAFFPKAGAFEYSKNQTGLGLAALGKPPTMDDSIERSQKVERSILMHSNCKTRMKSKRLQEENNEIAGRKRSTGKRHRRGQRK
jgi:hypothetical protein